jgi:major membrane immunogen (membrane-anchored lipoprotein)
MTMRMPPTLAVFAVLASACSHTMIPNTDVEDSDNNRKVVLFCEKYRHAVEEKDVPALLALASDRYYEDGGNANVEDDIDYAGLKDYLSTTFQKTKTVRYEIRYRTVTFTEKKEVHVDYTYTGSYRLPGIKSDEWRHAVADNRLILIPAGDSFKIVSGM